MLFVSTSARGITCKRATQKSFADVCAYAGNSVCAFIHGFEPYFYVEAPPGFGPDDCDSLRQLLDVRPVSSAVLMRAKSDSKSKSCLAPVP